MAIKLPCANETACNEKRYNPTMSCLSLNGNVTLWSPVHTVTMKLKSTVLIARSRVKLRQWQPATRNVSPTKSCQALRPDTFYFHQIWSKPHRSYQCTLAIPTGRIACHCETEKYLSHAPAKENFIPFIFIKSGQERMAIVRTCRRFSEKLKGNYTRRFLSGPDDKQVIAFVYFWCVGRRRKAKRPDSQRSDRNQYWSTSSCVFFQFVSRHRKAKRPDSEKQKDLTPDVLTGISIDLRVPA